MRTSYGKAPLKRVARILAEAFRCVDDPELREFIYAGTLAALDTRLTDDNLKPVFPERGERTALVLKRAKTASLFFDRVCDVRYPLSVPVPIRVVAPSAVFLFDTFINSLGDCIRLIQDSKLDTLPFPTRDVVLAQAKVALGLIGRLVPELQSTSLEDLQEHSSALDAKLLDNLLRFHCVALQRECGIISYPCYSSQAAFERSYQPGDVSAVILTLDGLGVIHESRLQWDQVLQFREDANAKKSVRRLLHWYDASFKAQSLKFIQEDLEFRLDDYASALKRHGIDVLRGTLSAVLDGKFVFGSTATSMGLAYLMQDPTIGLLAEGLLLSSKVLLEVDQRLLDYQSLKEGEMKEIAFVYDMKSRWGTK